MKSGYSADEAASLHAMSDSSVFDDTTESLYNNAVLEGEETFNEGDEAEKEVSALANNATKRIKFARFAVFSLLLVLGLSVTSLTYYFLHNDKVKDYEEGLQLFLKTLKATTVSTVANFYNAMNDLSEAVTLSSDLLFSTEERATRFLFVTVKFFESRASGTREQAGFRSVFWAPIVEKEQERDWIYYTHENAWWVDESREFDLATARTFDREQYEQGAFVDYIYKQTKDSVTGERSYSPVSYAGPYGPLWQVSPPPLSMTFASHDKFDKKFIRSAFKAVQRLRTSVYTDFFDMREASALQTTDEDHIRFHQQFTTETVTAESAYEHPHSMIISPIFSRVGDSNSTIVGLAGAIIAWDRYLLNLLPEGVRGIYCVIESQCDGSSTFYTYRLNGEKATYLGLGDLHEREFDSSAVSFSLMDPDVKLQFDVAVGHCLYSMTAYSSSEYKGTVATIFPLVITILVAVVFALVLLSFYYYDRFVKRRNDLVIDAAARSNAVLLELFPKHVRDRMLAEKGSDATTKSFMKDRTADGKPNADFFPETTIMFADLAGFTSWSSVREPSQVFILLETLYQAFDEIAKRRKVFKVETIGDCYVAVAGLPVPCKDHAVVMSRFAQECLSDMRTIVRELETTLGPDTGDLAMCIGLHSGPATAGVLRGDRARFQLFGDTMNTASRMESTGVKGKIQVSGATANILAEAGKGKWLTKREDCVFAKGKGKLETYFVVPRVNRRESASSGGHSSDADMSESKLDEKAVDATISLTKKNRLIDWVMDVVEPLMKEIVARRNAFGTPHVYDAEVTEEQRRELYSGERERGAVKETLYLPQRFYKEIAEREMAVQPQDIVLDPVIVEELRGFISKLADLYNENEFHNFQHCLHVTQSVGKLLSRVVGDTKNLHHKSYGITSDPLTHFAAILTAIAHDLDHPGVPNHQLYVERQPLAAKYGNKSIAEQHSFDLFWWCFMSDEFKNFRSAICCNDKALLRFRDLTLNLLMATDINDKGLKQLRDARWAKAFNPEALENGDDDTAETMNRKATIVLEHMIQASDISHTMQHWHVYRKWNQRFFFECTKAVIEGRADQDPKDYWYEGEISFFEFYIIPLARKLDTCGVFGVSSDEYLNYAESNRSEWAARGREIVAEMVVSVKEQEWFDRARSSVQSIPVVDDRKLGNRGMEDLVPSNIEDIIPADCQQEWDMEGEISV